MRECVRAGKRIDPEASGAFCADMRANLMATKDQLTTSRPANSSGSFNTIARPAQKGLAFRSPPGFVATPERRSRLCVDLAGKTKLHELGARFTVAGARSKHYHSQMILRPTRETTSSS